MSNDDFGKSIAKAFLYLILIALVVIAALAAPAYSNIHSLAERDRQERLSK